MFYSGISVERDNRLSVRLRTDIPLLVNIICFERDMTEGGRIRHISEDEIVCEPMRNFWNGIKHEGWPKPPTGGFKGFMNVLGTTMTHGNSEHFSEDSFALLSKEYMIFSIRMGFHYTTVESMMTADTAKNYVRMQYKEGGASLDRRERRIKLIRDILSRLGFEHSSFSDFLDTRLAHEPAEILAERLFQLGRLTMLTKQLDMALSNDAVAQWYTRDIMNKLGMAGTDEEGK
jgi:pyruvate,water dikinase